MGTQALLNEEKWIIDEFRVGLILDSTQSRSCGNPKKYQFLFLMKQINRTESPEEYFCNQWESLNASTDLLILVFPFCSILAQYNAAMVMGHARTLQCFSCLTEAEGES